MTQSMFHDIADFHLRFMLAPSDEYTLPKDFQKFRVQTLLEEVFEYAFAVGFVPAGIFPSFPDQRTEVKITRSCCPQEISEEAAFDALIDLVYFALGTAYIHGFPFKKGWDRVHAANMKKVRALRPADSKRDTVYDVIKPEGWEPPAFDDLLWPVTIDQLACNED